MTSAWNIADADTMRMSKFMRISADANPDAELRYTSNIYIYIYIYTYVCVVCLFYYYLKTFNQLMPIVAFMQRSAKILILI